MRHRCIYCSRQIFRVALSLDYFFVVYVVSLLQNSSIDEFFLCLHFLSSCDGYAGAHGRRAS